MEIWLPIKNYNYEVSNLGNIRNKKNHNILTNFDYNRMGYIRVVLYKNNQRKRFFIHRLVAESFIPNPQNKGQVNHKDGNKQNNKLENLEWVTCSENGLHYYRVLRGSDYKNKKDLDNKKLIKFQIINNRNNEIMKLSNSGIKDNELCKLYHLSPRQIRRIKWRFKNVKI